MSTDPGGPQAASQAPRCAPVSPGEPGRARALMARASALEKIMYASIGRAIIGRPLAAPGARRFSYHRPALSLLIVFLGLSTVEIFLTDLIVRRWIWVRIPFLVVDVWGAVWILGLLCAHLMRPHTVGADGIRVRNGLDWDVHVGWGDIASVRMKKRTYEPKTPKVFDDDGIRTLLYQALSQTNVQIVLRGPTLVVLPGPPPHGGPQIVQRVCLWTDDPDGYVAAVRERIG